MPRTPFICSADSVYHICTRANNREKYRLRMEEVWDIHSAYLHYISTAMNVKVHGFVLMNNHFHLLASFPEANLSEAILYFMRESSKEIGRASRRINHLYCGYTFRSEITSDHHFRNVYKYIYQNPLRAGACAFAEKYSYSTLGGLIGERHLSFPVTDRILIHEAQTEQVIDWINSPIDDRYLGDIRRGLRHTKFKLRKIAGRSHPLDTYLC